MTALASAVPSPVHAKSAAHLVGVIQELSLARDLPTIQRIVRTAARQLTGADGATFVLRDNGKCFYADEDAIEPLWKGMRFPMEICISGWAMLNRTPAVIPDIYVDARIPVEAYRPTFVKSLAMVPIRTLDPIGAIGNYWAQPHEPTEEEVSILHALADTTAVAMENVRVYGELEDRVRQRTQELEAANAEIQRLALVDEMTGLHNRRGFMVLANQSRKAALRSGIDQFIAYIDADGLKKVNDSLGHHAGDELLRSLGHLIQTSFRDADVVARLGGDEFCVMGTLVDGNTTAVTQRLLDGIADFNRSGIESRFQIGASVGVWICPCDSKVSIDDVLRQADETMYQDKRQRREALVGVALPV